MSDMCTDRHQSSDLKKERKKEKNTNTRGSQMFLKKRGEKMQKRLFQGVVS